MPCELDGRSTINCTYEHAMNDEFLEGQPNGWRWDHSRKVTSTKVPYGFDPRTFRYGLTPGGGSIPLIWTVVRKMRALKSFPYNAPRFEVIELAAQHMCYMIFMTNRHSAVGRDLIRNTPGQNSRTEPRVSGPTKRERRNRADRAITSNLGAL
jgi:hypothetical protein